MAFAPGGFKAPGAGAQGAAAPALGGFKLPGAPAAAPALGGFKPAGAPAAAPGTAAPGGFKIGAPAAAAGAAAPGAGLGAPGGIKLGAPAGAAAAPGLAAPGGFKLGTTGAGAGIGAAAPPGGQVQPQPILQDPLQHKLEPEVYDAVMLFTKLFESSCAARDAIDATPDFVTPLKSEIGSKLDRIKPEVDIVAVSIEQLKSQVREVGLASNPK